MSHFHVSVTSQKHQLLSNVVLCHILLCLVFWSIGCKISDCFCLLVNIHSFYNSGLLRTWHSCMDTSLGCAL